MPCFRGVNGAETDLDRKVGCFCPQATWYLSGLARAGGNEHCAGSRSPCSITQALGHRLCFCAVWGRHLQEGCCESLWSLCPCEAMMHRALTPSGFPAPVVLPSPATHP